MPWEDDIARPNLAITAALALWCAGSLGAQAAGSTMSGTDVMTGRLLRQMDRNRNGSVSRTEYSRFVGRTGRLGVPFDRLDTDHNGRLEQNELRPLIGGAPVRRHRDETLEHASNRLR